MTPPPPDRSPKPLEHPARSTPGLPDPSLLRLAHAVAELNPALAQTLCLAGLAAMTNPLDREAWKARLACFLDDGPPSGPDATLPA